MKNIRKWIVLVLTVAMLANMLCIGAAAARNESPVRLYVSPAVGPDAPIGVQVIASGAQTVADGKLVVTYDPDMLTYVGAETGPAWIDGEAVTLSVNAAEGKIILAFASSRAANAGTVFHLTFQANTNGHSTVALDSGSYITGAGAVSDSTVVSVSGQCVSVKLYSGAHGTFADGTTETTITTLADAALSASLLAPVVPDRGYTLSGWMTADGTVYSLAELDLVPTEGMTLTAQYTIGCDGANCPSAKFVDVANLSAEPHNAMDYMVANGYMNGMSQTMFGPHVELSRAMMVTILYRIAGTPAVEGTYAFTDVPTGRFYTEAVAWASENGITNGISAKLFAPDKSLTRQELVTFLYRFAQYMSYDVSASADLSGYTDTAEISPFARTAFSWAVAEGVIKGVTKTTLAPANTTTRVQVCLMVYRLLFQQD